MYYIVEITVLLLLLPLHLSHKNKIAHIRYLMNLNNATSCL